MMWRFKSGLIVGRIMINYKLGILAAVASISLSFSAVNVSFAQAQSHVDELNYSSVKMLSSEETDAQLPPDRRSFLSDYCRNKHGLLTIKGGNSNFPFSICIDKKLAQVVLGISIK